MNILFHPRDRIRIKKPYKLVLLTGIMGAGKSTLLQNITERSDVVCINADMLAKKHLYHKRNYNHLRNIFGDNVFVRGEISLPKVAHVFFTRSDIHAEFQKFARPIVQQALEKYIKKLSAQKGVKIIIIENAIGLEANWHKTLPLDSIVCLYCSPEEQARRLMASRNYSQTDIKNRTKNHWSADKKISLSDISINTEGSALEMDEVCDTLYKKLMSL